MPLLPSSGNIKLKGTSSADTTGVSVNIYGTPTSLRLTATIVRTLFGKASGTIKLTDGYGKCYSYCVCDGDCSCDLNCGCDLCPAPDVLIDMADGTRKRAGEIQIGDEVLSWDEKNKRVSKKRVTYVMPGENDRVLLRLSNGNFGEFADNHQFLDCDEKWVALKNLKVGDALFNGIQVIDTEPTKRGPVVFITVEELHTYFALGTVSHNVGK